MRLDELVAYLDDYLRIRELPDSANALNGLQVENGGEVAKLGVAVDASERTIVDAVERGCDCLIVHHGLFWDGNLPVTGRRHRRLSKLLESGVALYSAHIPLDAHPEVGNNAVLARALGIEVDGAFGDYRGVKIGVMGPLPLRREALAARMHDLLGTPVRFLAGGPERLQRVAVVTGAASDLIREACNARLDGFVSGEGPHHSYFEAMEGGINVYYGGHYATEVWGVRALGEHLRVRFGLPWEFLDHPTGF